MKNFRSVSFPARRSKETEGFSWRSVPEDIRKQIVGTELHECEREETGEDDLDTLYLDDVLHHLVPEDELRNGPLIFTVQVEVPLPGKETPPNEHQLSHDLVTIYD